MIFFLLAENKSFKTLLTMESHIEERTYSGSESESEEETTKLLFPVNGLSSLFISVNNVNVRLSKLSGIY